MGCYMIAYKNRVRNKEIPIKIDIDKEDAWDVLYFIEIWTSTYKKTSFRVHDWYERSQNLSSRSSRESCMTTLCDSSYRYHIVLESE
ncbi:MAG: hypothetical protein Sylvanvirus9_28 [Sylvanvirus sp.]|uniref:Uncharacterized protein n=1 Tax=Sylvanvirus sp. TaxID=2487774 RepID=A0A3G5AI11_9VIRU|nr:MAG: hypothetical protein Sylvanvirus9_28 [Sylvanvirus sp.]